MANNKKVKMPSGIRNKLTAALCMLLVSAIMLVSSTLAWFTLSTAPEVTGITTSVGANGNLEIALLTTDTYATPANITSAVGDSSETAGKDATTANITWGNIVDLSDASYGLSTLSLNQATPNINTETGALVVANPLKTAEYGADGRVIEVKGDKIVSAVKSATTGAFTYTNGSQTYGVRAVGQASNLTPRQTAFSGAKSAVTTNQANAVSGAKNAISGAGTTFAAIALSGSSPTSYSYSQVTAMKDIAAGIKSSLNSVVLVYANAGVVAAAADGSTATDEQVATVKDAITSDAATMKLALNTAGVTTYDSQLTALAAAQSDVNTALTNLNALLTANTEHSTFETTTNYSDSGNDVSYINDLLTSLIGSGSSAYDAYDENDALVTGSASELMSTAKKVYMKAGALGTLASYTGAFEIADMMGIKVFAGQKTDVANYPDISGYSAPAGASESNISDSFGYILDFAFRTNAADSYLQLQTTAANRVYSDANDANLATMGEGSKVSFTYGAETSTEQAENLLNNINLIFFDPAAGTIFARAHLTSIAAAAGSATANVVLDVADPEADQDNIVALQQNEIKFVSVLVYLEGETLTNADVANAIKSGDLDLNLQFSSSATLVPMENTDLRNRPAA